MQDLKGYAKEYNVPIIQDQGLVYLLETVKKYNCKNILELGTAIGYSSINMARLDDEITIKTIEKKRPMYEEAIKNIEDAGLSNRITCFNMNIDDYNTDEKFDLIFVDAAKAQYLKYLEHFTNNINDDGIFFFDNLAFHGLVDDPSLCQSRNTRQLVRKIKNFTDTVLEDDRYECEYFPEIGDGIMILKIRKEKL